MDWQYIKLSLITSFGGRSQKPLRTAIWRIVLTFAVVAGFSYMCLPVIRQLPLASGLPKTWWLIIIAVGIQLLAGVVIMMSQTVIPARSSLIKLLLCLPTGIRG